MNGATMGTANAISPRAPISISIRLLSDSHLRPDLSELVFQSILMPLLLVNTPQIRMVVIGDSALWWLTLQRHVAPGIVQWLQ